jgi:hypothetical protein
METRVLRYLNIATGMFKGQEKSAKEVKKETSVATLLPT